MQDIKDKAIALLESKPEQGWVFGVCPAFAKRSGWRLAWVRLTTIVLFLLVPVTAAFAYFIAAMLSDEVRPRAQARMSRWARKADAVLDQLKNAWSEDKKSKPMRGTD